MLRGMSSIQWMHWKVYMQLAPFGEERDDIRAALIALATWNVQIAKAQGSWDSAKTRRGRRPEQRKIDEFILRFGDMPSLKPKQTGQQQFDALKDVVASWGMQPVNRPAAPPPEEKKPEPDTPARRKRAKDKT